MIENFKSLLLLLLLHFIAQSTRALSDVNTSLTSSGSLERGSVFDSLDTRFDPSSILLLNLMTSMNTSMTMMQTTMTSINKALYILVDRVESLSDRVEALSNQTNRRFDSIGKRFDEIGKRFDSIGKRFDSIGDSIGKGFDEIGKRFDSIGKRVDSIGDSIGKRVDSIDEKFASMDKRFDSMDKTLQEFLSSTLTSRSVDLVNACARKSVFLVTFSSTNGGDLNENGSNLIRHCSAFSYKPFPSRDAVIVTSSHCFSSVYNKTSFLNKTPFVVFLSILDQHVRHECSVLDFRGSPDDATILSCPTLINIPGLSSSKKARLSQLVAITGFAPYDNSDSPFLALNVDFSRIVSIAGPPHKLQDGSVCVSSDDEMIWPVHPSGFVDSRVAHGISGGPILDLKCGVIGIALGRTCSRGSYTNLSGVDEFIMRNYALGAP
jgi:tetrahydromethanopterin S-methyltransferase subunit G